MRAAVVGHVEWVRFARVEQLRETKLVNNATYERIKDLVTAE